MQDWIREKLAVVEEVFPPERVERSKQRWTRLWRTRDNDQRRGTSSAGSGQAGPRPTGLHEPLEDRYPFVYCPAFMDYYSPTYTPEECLRLTLEEVIVHGRLSDDFIPAIFPGCRQATIPNMFGAVEVRRGDDLTCDRIINSAADIASLPEPSIAPGTIAHEWLERADYFVEQTDGRLPVHVTDMQGPADALSQMWGYDQLFLTGSSEPEVALGLLDRVAEAFIVLWRAQKERLGELFVGTHLFGWDWVPPDAGASLSADSLTMISPAFFEAIYRPHLEKVASALGPLSVHSCGQFAQVVPSLCATPGVVAVNAGQMSIRALHEAGLTSDQLVIAMTHIDEAPNTFRHLFDTGLRADVSVFLPFPTEDGKLGQPELWTEDDWSECRRREDELLTCL